MMERNRLFAGTTINLPTASTPMTPDPSATIYGSQPILRTEWSQMTPPSGLGYLPVPDEKFAQRTGEGPKYGDDPSWQPLHLQKSLQDGAKRQMREWNVLTPASFVEHVLNNNIGNTFGARATPYVLPTVADQPRALHPLVKPFIGVR